MLAEAQDLPPETLLEAIPESLKDMTAVLSAYEIIGLIHHFAGTTLHVPLTIKQGSALAEALGMDTAQRLCEFCGGEAITVPTGRKIQHIIRTKKIKELRSCGESIDALARRFQVTSRAIYLALSDH
jgi:hypothetical protein